MSVSHRHNVVTVSKMVIIVIVILAYYAKLCLLRVLGNIMELLPTDKKTEVQRTDLVGKFVVRTRRKTRRNVRIYSFLYCCG